MSDGKSLNLRQAQSCENALKPTCRCRCGGALHGAQRAGAVVPSEAWFASLPPDDPHYRPTAVERKAAKRKEREEAQQRRWELLGKFGNWHDG